MRKIGIMGGTFDPIHIAHLILAEQGIEEFHLDEVIFIPTGQPPHKAGKPVTNASYRYEMVELAIRSNPKFTCSDIEILREGNTYTAKTLEILHNQSPEDEFYFILGADSLSYIDKWFHPEIIFKLSTIIVANRNQMEKRLLDEQIQQLLDKYGGKIWMMQTPNLEISSNYLRKQVAKGVSIQYYVPNEVNAYIKERALYKNEDEV